MDAERGARKLWRPGHQLKRETKKREEATMKDREVLKRLVCLITVGLAVIAVIALAKPASAADRWKRVTSPQGRVSVELPEGWEMKQMDQEELRVSLGPVGRDFPVVGIWGWLDVVSVIHRDNRFMCHQVGVKELYEQLLLPLLHQKLPDIRIEQMVPTNPTTTGRVEGSLTYQGRKSRFIDVVVMEYLADPTLSFVAGCRQPWWSYAFIGGLIASPQEVPALEPVVERIFSTFRPTPRWGAEVVEPTLNGMQWRMARIHQTLARLTQMETQQRMSEMQSFRRINQRWVDTLGGNYRYKDATDSKIEGTIRQSEIPRGPTRWWQCGKDPPRPYDRSPGYGCRETDPPH